MKPRSPTIGIGSTTSFAPLPSDGRGDMRHSVQERVREYGAIYDPVSGSSSYHFKGSDGQYIEGWFEDWWSLQRKVDYLVTEQIGGIAFFLLGYDGGHLVDFFIQQRKFNGVAEILAPTSGAQSTVSATKN